MIKLNESLSAEKLAQITKDLERLKKLPRREFRDDQIKAIERILEANEKCQKKSVKKVPEIVKEQIDEPMKELADIPEEVN